MMKMTRVMAFLLLAVMLISAAACGTGDAGTNDPANTTAAAVTTAPAETADPATQLNIPDGITYPDYVFSVANGYAGDGKYVSDSMFVREMTGEVLEDAFYDRTLKIEERFGITLEEQAVDYNGFINSVLADTGEFELCTATLSNVMTVVNRKVVYDLYDIPTLDLDKPWWDQNAEDKLSFDGHLYYTFSDFVITGMDNSRAVYFNKTLREQLGLPDLYEMVRNGTWTYDKMAEMCDNAQSDLNGDTVINENDRLGTAGNCTTFYEAMLTACDAEIVKQGDDGIPYFFCLDRLEQFTNVYSTLLDTFSANDRFYITNSGEKMFTDGNLLFYVAALPTAVRMRATDVDFGILPNPKWDEKQENYLNVSPNGHAFMIPTSVRDPERTGTILEALSYYSSKYHSDKAVMPAYFETALTIKSARDEESAESLQIIHDNISYVIKIVGIGFSDSIYAQFNAGNPNITPLLKASEKVLRRQVENTLAALREE